MSSTPISPRLGASVIYTLNEQDAKQIIQERLRAGSSTAQGNDPRDGSSYPAIVVADHGFHVVNGKPILMEQGSVNLQVFLDGNDVYWATSRSMFDPVQHGRMKYYVQDAGSTEWRAVSKDEYDVRAELLNDPGSHVQGSVSEQFVEDRRGHWSLRESTPAS